MNKIVSTLLQRRAHKRESKGSKGRNSAKNKKSQEVRAFNNLLSCLAECLTLARRMGSSFDIDGGIRALEKGRTLALEAGYPLLETPMLHEMIQFIVWLDYPQSLQYLTLRAIELNREIFGNGSTGLFLHLVTHIESLMHTKKKHSCEKFIQEALPIAIEKQAFHHELLFRHLLVEIYDKQKKFALSKEHQERIEFIDNLLLDGDAETMNDEIQRLEDMSFVEFEREYNRQFGLDEDDASASLLLAGVTPTQSLR